MEETHERTAPFETHSWFHSDEEYGGLASGGDYDVYTCSVCGKKSYSQMAD